jgi:hypothetical protein
MTAAQNLGRFIWRCWHDNLSYDPTQHRALQNLLIHTANKAA